MRLIFILLSQHDPIPTKGLEESPENGDHNFTKSKNTKTRSGNILILFNGKRERDGSTVR